MPRLSQATLGQRTGYLYRHLLLIRRLFPTHEEQDASEWFAADADGEATAMRGAVRDVLDELAEHAQVLTTVPFPIREWQPGDGPDDERWRALTEVERREVLALVSAYDDLITWAERQTKPRLDVPPREQDQAAQYLQAERARVARFRRDMAFLEKRRIAENSRGTNAIVNMSRLPTG
jgi:hypothetical protein